MDKIKEAEEYAQQFKTSASSEGLENIANDYLAGYKAGASKYEGLLREAMEALKAASGHIDYLTGTDTTVMGLKLKAIITKSKSILND